MSDDNDTRDDDKDTCDYCGAEATKYWKAIACCDACFLRGKRENP